MNIWPQRASRVFPGGHVMAAEAGTRAIFPGPLGTAVGRVAEMGLGWFPRQGITGIIHSPNLLPVGAHHQGADGHFSFWNVGFQLLRRQHQSPQDFNSSPANSAACLLPLADREFGTVSAWRVSFENHRAKAWRLVHLVPPIWTNSKRMPLIPREVQR
jgi:hypothetical protein